jgi:hypothetical protein
LPSEDRTEEQRRRGEKKLAKLNDHMYPLMRDHLKDREWGSTGFETEVGPYVSGLRANNEHIKNVAEFANNFLGSDEYGQVKVGDSRNELEQEYGTVVDSIEEMVKDEGDLLVTTEMDDKVFGVTAVGREKHIEEAMEAYD